MLSRRVVLWIPLALAAAAALGACAKVDDPAAPFPDSQGGNNLVSQGGVEWLLPVPAALASTRVFEVPGDPSCCTLDGGPYARFGFRLAAFTAGFHPLTADAGSGTCNAPPQDAQNGITLLLDGASFSWTSTMPVGAVIVGSAAGARVYTYTPASWGDTGLHAPLEAATQEPAAIASLEICYDYALQVQTAVTPSWTRTVGWSLQQTVSPDHWGLNPGDGATSRVTVQVAPTETVDQPPMVSGVVTVTNPSPLPATISSYSNVISVGIVAPLDCALTLPYVLGPGQSIQCTFTYQLPDTRPRTDTVFMRATGVVKGGTGTTSFTFGERQLVNGAVQVESADGQTWGPFDAAASFTYDRHVDPSLLGAADQGVIPLRVAISGTDITAETGIALRVYRPALTHELTTSFLRTWQWVLARDVQAHEVVLGAGQSLTVEGVLRATAQPGPGSDFQAAGQVAVHNPHPARALSVSGLRALLTLEGTGSLECADAFQVPAGGEVACGLQVDLPDGTTRTSHVVASYQNFEFAADGSAAPTGTTMLEHAQVVAFEAPTLELDRCAHVSDSAAGVTVSLCAEASPWEMAAPLAVGPYAACGVFQLDGVAELIGADTQTRAEVAYAVTATVPCTESCTRGAGYWKTHSQHGPAPYDATWAQLPGGADTPLFSGQLTYFDVLWRPTRGNPWISLARQWVAAHLNRLAGADPTAVGAAYTEAESLLRSTPASAVTAATSRRMAELAELLAAWNEGKIGPGACDDTD